MATDFSSRPQPPVLKRFANLDIDGVDKPERPERPEPRDPRAKDRTPAIVSPTAARPAPNGTPDLSAARAEAARPRDRDLADFEDLAADLNANATSSRAEAARPRPSRFNQEMPDTPENQYRQQRAAELRRGRPPDPPSRRPASRGAMVSSVGVETNLWDLPRAPAIDRQEILDYIEERGLTPGVMTMEVDLSRRGRAVSPSAAVPRAEPARSQARSYVEQQEMNDRGGFVTTQMDLRRGRPGARDTRELPLEVTPLAARQIQLMAWEAGVPGSPLRILSAHTPGLGRPEIDFAFDDKTEADDIVFECNGVTILVDPASLRWVRGRRITWHDVPGSEGFHVG